MLKLQFIDGPNEQILSIWHFRVYPMCPFISYANDAFYKKLKPTTLTKNQFLDHK